MKRLTVLGSVNADHVLNVSRFPQPGETLTGHNYRVIPGGKGANQVVAAARMGAAPAFIAMVGEDAFGEQMLSAFAEEGIDTRAVMTAVGKPSGIAIIQVNSEGENSICIAPESNACLTPERLTQHLPLIHQADCLLMQLETPLDTLMLAAKEAVEHNTQVILNPAPATVLSDEFLQLVDVITPNQTEAHALTGIAVSDGDSAAQAAQVLHEKGIPLVIITLGSQGAWVSRRTVDDASVGIISGQMVPGFHVEVRDTTAAGDTFNGALACCLLEGKPLTDAVRIAHAAAAVSVTRDGAQPSVPLRQEVEAFMRNAAVL